MKRYRTPSAKPGELKVSYGKIQHDRPDICYCYGGGGVDKRDGIMLSNFFEVAKDYDGYTLREELERRGYDIETIRFSIRQKPKQVTE